MDATTASPVSTADRGPAALMMFALRRDDAGRAERRRDHDHEHEHHRHDHAVRERDDDSTSRVFISLKAEVEGTLRDLVEGDPDTDEAAAPDAEFDAELKARVRISGPDGRIDLKMKLELDDVDAETFQSALQSFTETLYSALRALYGQDTQPAAPAPSDSAAVTAAALAADAPAAAPTPAPAATTSTTAPATDVATTTDGAAETAPATTPPASSGSGSVSLQLRLRLTYSSFGDSVGTLAQRLAQPDGASGVPASIFDDLTERFERLLDAAGGAEERPGLAAFLRALADRLSPPADAVLPGEPAPAPTTPEATPPQAVSPSPTGSFSVSLRFTAIYRQMDAVGAPAPQPLALAA